MPGTFDEIIKQQMRGSQRGLGYQDARDRAARQMNMAERGLNSTATPLSAQQAPPQPPSMDQLIQAQLGEQMPIPGPRPEPVAMAQAAPPPVQQMGDASVMEAALAGGIPPQPGNVEQMMTQQVGLGPDPYSDPSTLPIDQMALPSQVPGVGSDAANVPNQQGYDPTNLIATVVGLGGAAGLISLLTRARMGDANAARTIQSTGIPPEQLDEFARTLEGQRSAATQKTPKQAAKKRPRGDTRSQKSNASNANEKTRDADDGKTTKAEQIKRSEQKRFKPNPSKPRIKVKVK